MKEDAVSAVVASIHAAGLYPSGWDNVLRRLAALTGCIAGGLTIERPSTRRGTPLTYFGFDPDHVARTFDKYLPLNPLFEIAPRMQRGFVVTNGDVVNPAVFRRSEFYNGWARPQGLCSPITVVVHRTKAAYVPLTLVRPDGAGEVTAQGRALLSRLAPHLVHAMDITLRLQASNAARHDLAAVLEALPCSAVLIGRSGQLVFANSAAENLLGQAHGMLTCLAGRIVIRDPGADRLFQAAVSAALGLGAPAKAGHLFVQNATGKAQLSIKVTPVPPQDDPWASLGEDTDARARCLVLFSTPNVAKLAEQYGLTPSESRVVAAVMVGRGLAAAAHELGIARSTAQSHLDKVFQKTGTNRQVELVRLVQSGFGS